jgi:DNA-binding SARP family transcriptional activator
MALSEEATRELMRAHAAAGDLAAALGAYARLEERLERELSARPSPETRRLLAELRAEAPPPLGTKIERRLGEDPRL